MFKNDKSDKKNEESLLLSFAHIIYYFFLDIITSLANVITMIPVFNTKSNVQNSNEKIIIDVQNAIRKEIFYNYALDGKKQNTGNTGNKDQQFSRYMSIIEFTYKYFLIPKPLRSQIIVNCQKILTSKRHEFFNAMNNMDGMYFLSQKLLSILKIYENRFQQDNIQLLSRILSYNVINCRCRVFDYIIFELLLDFHNHYIKIFQNVLEKNLKRSIKYT